MDAGTIVVSSGLIAAAVFLIVAAPAVGRRRMSLRSRLTDVTSEAALARRRRAEALARLRPILDSSPKLNRLVQPPLVALGEAIDRLLRRETPEEETRLAQRLAAVEPDSTPGSFRGQQVLLFFFGFALLPLAGLLSIPVLGGLPPAFWILPAFGAAMLPWIQLRSKVAERQEHAETEMPGFIELLVLGVAAGQSPEQSLQGSAQPLSGPLGDTIRGILAEAAVGGRSYQDGLRAAARREGLPILDRLADAWELNRSGVPMNEPLQQMARDLTQAQTLALVSAAGAAGFKMLAPMLLLVFPSVMLMMMYPVFSTLVQRIAGL